MLKYKLNFLKNCKFKIHFVGKQKIKRERESPLRNCNGYNSALDSFEHFCPFDFFFFFILSNASSIFKKGNSKEAGYLLNVFFVVGSVVEPTSCIYIFILLPPGPTEKNSPRLLLLYYTMRQQLKGRLRV